jgi:hypothetical protein
MSAGDTRQHPAGVGRDASIGRIGTRMRFADPGYALLLLVSAAVSAQDFDLDWWTVDGGGEVLSETADQQWQLSGALGQWDSTESLALSGAGWTLTGGFWPVNIDRTDLLFRDGFED